MRSSRSLGRCSVSVGRFRCYVTAARNWVVPRDGVAVAALVVLPILSLLLYGPCGAGAPPAAPTKAQPRRPATRLVVSEESYILPDSADDAVSLQTTVAAELAEAELAAGRGNPEADAVSVTRADDRIPATVPGLLDFRSYGYPPAINVNGHVLIPLDGFADWTGDSVVMWRDRVALMRGESQITFVRSQDRVVIVEKEFALPCPPGWYQGSPMVPVSGLARIIGFDCFYSKQRQVAVLGFYGTQVEIPVEAVHPDDYFRNLRASRRIGRAREALLQRRYAAAAAEALAILVHYPNSDFWPDAREVLRTAFAMAQDEATDLTDLPPAPPVEGRHNPVVEVRNTTFLKLTVYWGGPTDTSVVVPPGGTARVTVAPGVYKIAAKVDDTRVVSLTRTMAHDQGCGYTLVFALSQLG